MLRKFFPILFIMVFANCNDGPQAKEPARLHVFSSSNLLGYLEPCG